MVHHDEIGPLQRQKSWLDVIPPWVELFGKSWWGKMPCQLMVVFAKAGKQEFKCEKVFKSDSFVSLRWKMFVWKPEKHKIWQKLAGQSTKLVGQTWKLVGQSPHQLYRKLRPWIPHCLTTSKHWTQCAASFLVRTQLSLSPLLVDKVGHGAGGRPVATRQPAPYQKAWIMRNLASF